MENMETLTLGEQRFERNRKRLGLFLAPIVFITMFFAPLALAPNAHTLAAIISTVIILWICESIPMPVTALMGAAAAVVLQVAPAKDVLAPFSDPLIFLFIGSFMLSRAVFLRNIDKRLAFAVLSLKWVDARPSRILFAFGLVTVFISGWMSNTATTAMMLAIGLSIIAFLLRQEKETGIKINKAYPTALMLMTSFAASIGGMATPIGTPPNLIGLGFIRKLTDNEIPFFEWMMIGVPVVVVLFIFLFFYLNFLAPAGVKRIDGAQEMIAAEREKLGGWTRGQKSVVFAFSVAVTLWILSGLVALVTGETSTQYKTVSARFPEAIGALIGASLLFLLPGDKKGEKAITWTEAVKIDWGVILLYGGGFALGVLSFQTGLAESVGRGLTSMIPLGGEIGLLVVGTLIAIIVSETKIGRAHV
jgi:sodium-dependent dicarboxylate transporter 2/3/5